MPSEPEESPTLVQILLLAAGVNVVLYTLWSVAIGGTALTGTIVDGHYFVQSRGHGAEVSSTVWHINRWHGIGVIVGVSVAVISTLVARLYRRARRWRTKT